MASHGMALKHRKAKNNKSLLDKIVYFFAFAAPVFEIPQFIKILSAHSSKNVSLLTWGFFALASFIWLLYGLKHWIRPLIISYLLFTSVETVVVVSIIWYR